MEEVIKNLAKTLLYALDLEAEHNPEFNAVYNSNAQWPETMTEYDWLHASLKFIIEHGTRMATAPHEAGRDDS